MAPGIPLASRGVTRVHFLDWAPNLHAVVVHLPIGLLATAAGADLLAILCRETGTAYVLSTCLQIAGTIMLVAAYLTGRKAAADVYTPGLAQAVVTLHWDQAWWCVWYFGLATASRITVWVTLGQPRRQLAILLALVSLGGLWLLTDVGKYGAQLVYTHGTGVTAPSGR